MKLRESSRTRKRPKYANGRSEIVHEDKLYLSSEHPVYSVHLYVEDVDT